MSHGTRSKAATHSKRTESPPFDDDGDNVYSQDLPDSQPRSTQITNPLVLSGSTILQHNFGYLYPIPTTTKSPQIATFQSGVQGLSNRVFQNATGISLWFDEFLSQALLPINQYA